MKDFLTHLSAAVRNLDINGILTTCQIGLNPFSSKRKRIKETRYTKYTRDILIGEDFEIGEYTYGIPTVLKNPGMKVRIGKFCSFAPGLILELRGSHTVDFVTTYPFGSFVDDWPGISKFSSEQYWKRSKDSVTIGNDVWTGINVTILSGVRVGDGAAIGAGSVVVNDVEPFTIVGGNPAKLLRKRFDDETIRKLLEIKWWDWPSEKINRNLHILLSNNISELFKL